MSCSAAIVLFRCLVDREVQRRLSLRSGAYRTPVNQAGN